MPSRILITGAAGFVGRQVLRHLTSVGVPTRVVLRRKQPPYPSLESCSTERIDSPDIFSESLEWWIETCRDVDTIIHLAWYAEPGRYLSSPRNLDCLQGTLCLARAAIAAGVRRFVGIGTCFEYDLTLGDLLATTPLNPTTPYSAAKAASYLALSNTLPLEGTSFAWCRLFYLYGEGEHPARLYPALRLALSRGQPINLTSGRQIRDFLNVSDAGTRIAQVALGNRCGAINICSGLPITVRQFAEQVADEFGRRDLLIFNARPDNLIDPPRVVGVPND